MVLNKVQYIGNDRHYFRFYPNIGFAFTVNNYLFKWSWFYGWNDRRGILKPKKWAVNNATVR